MTTIQIIIWVIAWIWAFMFLVFIHELGHFTAAKKLWVKVLEFGMGIPPKVARLWTDKWGTEYTLNAIPLWGFVRLKGEDPTDKDDFHAPDSFVSVSLRRKAIILLAGIAVNLAFAFVLLTAIFSVWLSPESLLLTQENATNKNLQTFLYPSYTYLDEAGFLTGSAWNAVVAGILSGGIADTAWFLSWDVIAAINNIPVNSITLYWNLAQNMWKEFVATITRDWISQELTMTCPDINCMLWIYITSPNSTVEVLPIKYWFVAAMWVAWQEMLYHSKMTFSVLWDLFWWMFSWNTKLVKETASQFSWPVAIVGILTQILNRSGITMFLYLVALISLALAVFNLLPIPALDGGRLLGMIIMHTFSIQKEKYYKIEWYINAFFFLLLMIAGIAIIIKDIWVIQTIF